MRRRSLGRLGVVATGLGIGCAVLACTDARPTLTEIDSILVRFALSEASARGFDDALDDVRDRILPALGAVEAAQSLGPLLDELTAALAARDQSALRRALARIEAKIAQLGQGDDAAAAIGSELDAVRLILEHARPLAAGETGMNR